MTEIELMKQIFSKFGEIHDLLTELFLVCRNKDASYNCLKRIDEYRSYLHDKGKYEIDKIAEEYFDFSITFNKEIKQKNNGG